MVEINILMALQELHTPVLDFIFTHITMLGDEGIFWIAVGIILLCTKKYRKQGLLLLLCLLGSFLVGNVFLKNLVQRERPCWMYPEVELLVKNPKDFSFPSAHSMVGFAGATAMWHMDRKVGIAAYILAALIAFSRLYLFVHWPTDVLVGILIGVLVGNLVFYLAGRKEKGSGNREQEGDAGYENV